LDAKCGHDRSVRGRRWTGTFQHGEPVRAVFYDEARRLGHRSCIEQADCGSARRKPFACEPPGFTWMPRSTAPSNYRNAVEYQAFSRMVFWNRRPFGKFPETYQRGNYSMPKVSAACALSRGNRAHKTKSVYQSRLLGQTGSGIWRPARGVDDRRTRAGRAWLESHWKNVYR